MILILGSFYAHKKSLYIFIFGLITLNIYLFVKNISGSGVTQNAISTEASVNSVYDDFSQKIENINELVDNEITGLVYVGRDTCINCLKFNEILREETNANPSIKIYKFDTDFWRKDDMFQYVLDKYEITQIPVLLKINETTYKKFIIDNEKMTVDDYRDYLKNFISK